MLLLLPPPPYTYTAKAAPGTGDINWDEWPAIGTLILAAGTLILALVTLWTLLYTIRATKRDREQAKTDREAADKRLTEERQAGDQRVMAEREHAADMRRRDRQRDNVAVLVGRIAQIQSLMPLIPGSFLRLGTSDKEGLAAITKETLGAITSLRHGVWTQATMLGRGEAAEEAARRYRALVQLVDEASLKKSFTDRDMVALRNYAWWVLISLRTLAEDETVPQLAGGVPKIPVLGLAAHMPAWLPDPPPRGWDNIGEADGPIHKASQVRIGIAGPSGQAAEHNGAA